MTNYVVRMLPIAISLGVISSVVLLWFVGSSHLSVQAATAIILSILIAMFLGFDDGIRHGE